MSWTAASMCPWLSHCGSNRGDLLGMRTYALSRSTMEVSQVLAIEPLSRFRSMSGLIKYQSLRVNFACRFSGGLGCRHDFRQPEQGARRGAARAGERLELVEEHGFADPGR